MPKRLRPRSNHKPRGAALLEYRWVERVRAVYHARMERTIAGYVRNNHVNVTWAFAAEACPTCGQNLCEVLAHPGPDRPLKLCLNCDSSNPFRGVTIG
jgi:hypothetical protein